jgi:cubilin
VSVNGTVDLLSPGFPFGYAPNLLCEWVFEVPPTFHAALYFHTLNVEQQSTCNYDYVAVYSSKSQSTSSLLFFKRSNLFLR